MVFDLDGKYVRLWKINSIRRRGLDRISMTLDHSGQLMFISICYEDILIYRCDGKLSVPYQFDRPSGLVIHAALSHIYIAEWENLRVSVFESAVDGFVQYVTVRCDIPLVFWSIPKQILFLWHRKISLYQCSRHDLFLFQKPIVLLIVFRTSVSVSRRPFSTLWLIAKHI